MALLKAFVLPLLLAAGAAVGGGFLGVYVGDGEAGPIVESVIPGTPAARAGLKAGDRFVSVDGKETRNSGAFLEILGSHDPGDAVQIVFVRERATISKRIVLGKRPANLGEEQEGEEHEEIEEVEEKAEEAKEKAEAAEKAEKAREAARPDRPTQLRPRGGGQPYLGVQVHDADGGVGVDAVVEGSPAARAGVAAGDVILRVGRSRVADVSGLSEVLGGNKVGDRVDVVVRRGDERVTLKVALGQRDAPAIRVEPRPTAARERAAAPRTERRAAAAEAEASDEAEAVRALRREIAELRREIAELRKIVDKLDR